MSAATIPMTGYVAALIGPAAEHIENRSLLLDKFVFHKRWPVVEEHTRRGRDFVKWDEASRWSFMRIADGAEQILRKEAADKRRKADGQNVEPDNADRYLAEAKIAETLAGVKWDNPELSALRSTHTRRFLSLFRAAYGERSAITVGQLQGRLAINLADSLIQNAGICLDRLFGLPFIPGSAVKGVTRHTALEELKAAEGNDRRHLVETFIATFGCAKTDFDAAKPSRKHGDPAKPPGALFSYLDLTKAKDQKGAVSFLPAYPLNAAKIVVDLTNVHYPVYYRSGRTEDLSKEKPQPNPFPAVETGAQFAFCLVLNGLIPEPALLQSARRWLESALTIRGLGAKTASGYGWFSLKPEILEKIEMAEKEERERAGAKIKAAAEETAARLAEEKRLSSLSPENAAAELLTALSIEQFAVFGKELGDKTETEQAAFIELLTSEKEMRDRWKRWKKKKPEIVQAVEAVHTKLNLPPLP